MAEMAVVAGAAGVPGARPGELTLVVLVETMRPDGYDLTVDG